MTQKILPPEKILSSSIIHPLQSSDLKHPSKGAFFFFLNIAILSLHYDPAGFCGQHSSGERIHPLLPLDTQAGTEDTANLGLIWGNIRKCCEIPTRLKREKSATGPCNSGQKF